MCDARLWQKMLNFVPHVHPVHCDYSNASTIDHMVDSILTQAPEKAHLIGFSLGGYLGCLAALKEPQRFASVTAVAASPAGLTENERSLRRRNVDVLKNQPYKGLSKRRLHQLLHPNQRDNQELIGTILQMEKELGKRVLMRQLLAPINRRNISKELLQLTIPIQFVMAEDDLLVPMDPAKKLSELSPYITLHRISGSGHMVPLEAPEKLASLLP